MVNFIKADGQMPSKPEKDKEAEENWQHNASPANPVQIP
jgi:hypothetical protein